MAKAEECVLIKKYATRRLYNTKTSDHITLEDVAAMAKRGEDFRVIDAKSGEDLTRIILMQVIFEQEKKLGQQLLPITVLRQLIRFYGDGTEMLVRRYLEVTIEPLMREQEMFQRHISQPFGVATRELLEEQARRNLEIFEQVLQRFGRFMRRGQSSDESSNDKSSCETG